MYKMYSSHSRGSEYYAKSVRNEQNTSCECLFALLLLFIYLDAESKGSTQFTDPMASGCHILNIARVLLRA